MYLDLLLVNAIKSIMMSEPSTMPPESVKEMRGHPVNLKFPNCRVDPAQSYAQEATEMLLEAHA